jgi:hypothetical protein
MVMMMARVSVAGTVRRMGILYGSKHATCSRRRLRIDQCRHHGKHGGELTEGAIRTAETIVRTGRYQSNQRMIVRQSKMKYAAQRHGYRWHRVYLDVPYKTIN